LIDIFELQPRPIAEQALDELQKNPRDLHSMFMLNCVVGNRPIYEDLRVKIPNVLTELDVVQFFKTSPDECSQFILFISQLAASSADVAQMNKVWDEYLRLASYLANKRFIKRENACASPANGAFAQQTLLSDVVVLTDGRKAGLQMFVAKLTDVGKRMARIRKPPRARL